MDSSQLHRANERPDRGPGQLRQGVAYVARTPELLIPLAMMALVGTLSYNFQILLPLLADFTWHGTATTYALLTTSMGVGSVETRMSERGISSAPACRRRRRGSRPRPAA